MKKETVKKRSVEIVKDVRPFAGEVSDFVVTFTRPLIGAFPKDPEVYTRYISGKAPEGKDVSDEEDTAKNLEYAEQAGWTTFGKTNDGELFIYDYVIKGFLKAAYESLISMGEVTKIWAYKKWFDKMVFVYPRQILLGKKEPDGVLERPLRVDLRKIGEVSTLARGDYVEEGTAIKFTLEVLKNDKKIDMSTMEKCLIYGRYVGIGPWRGSGGYGQFEYMKLNDDTPKKKIKRKAKAE